MRRYRILWLSLVLLLALQPAPSAAQSSFYLKDGDRVVFFGDSITEQRLYTSFVEEYVRTRFPGMNVMFVHSGVGGDRVSGGWAGPIDQRLERDVIAYRPTVVTIMLGMNDGSYQPLNDSLLQAYQTGYRRILETLTRELPEARITLIRPSPFDEVTRPATIQGGYNTVLERYGDFVAELGREYNTAIADLNAPVVAMLERANQINPDIAKLIIPDRVHPEEAGHLAMAQALLKAWNAPALVASVAIAAAGAQVTSAENTEVTNLAKHDDGLSWNQQDKALPMPLSLQNDVVNLALEASSFVEALNRQPLQVTGLTPGRYRLTIDDTEVGIFTQNELAAGINLAVLPTPMARQARSVHWGTRDHNDLHATAFRLLVRQADDPRYADAAEVLHDYEQKVVENLRGSAQPTLHRYRLQRL